LSSAFFFVPHDDDRVAHLRRTLHSLCTRQKLAQIFDRFKSYYLLSGYVCVSRASNSNIKRRERRGRRKETIQNDAKVKDDDRGAFVADIFVGMMKGTRLKPTVTG